MRYLVIGSTGAIGLRFCQQALATNHTLVLYVRDKSRLDPLLANSPEGVTVVEGELIDRETLASALKDGVDAVITFAGPSPSLPFVSSSEKPLTEGYTVLFEAMKQTGVKRVLVLSTASHHDPLDVPSWKRDVIIRLIRHTQPAAYADIVSFSALTASQPLESIEHTLFRVPILHNTPGGEKGEVYAGYEWRASYLARERCAAWCLKELQVGRWVGKAPQLSDA